MENKVKVYAIVVCFNPNIQLLNDEYVSLINQVEGIYYIDNSSRNKAEIKKWGRNKTANFVWLNENKGIGFAQNIGIKCALEAGASHVILFDQDSVINKDFVQNLLLAECHAINDGVNVGITGPIYRSPVDNYIYPITTFDGKKYCNIEFEKDLEYIKVTHVIASGELIRKEVFEKIGLMRDDLFISQVDFEYCFRASYYGFQTIRAPKAIMNHIMGDNQIRILGHKVGLYSPFRRYFTCRNGLLLRNDKYYPRNAALYSFKVSILRMFISLFWGPSRYKQLKFCLRGFWDGWHGISGKCPY